MGTGTGNIQARTSGRFRQMYEQEKAAAFQHLHSPEGQQKYEQVMPALLVLCKAISRIRFQKAAHEAAVARIEQLDFQFPEYAMWALNKQFSKVEPAA